MRGGRRERVTDDSGRERAVLVEGFEKGGVEEAAERLELGWRERLR